MDWLMPVTPVEGAEDTFEVTPYSTLLGTFGSFLMACAVRAAAQTVDSMVLCSLRADFLTPPTDGPVRFGVERTRTGRAVAVRRVVVGDEQTNAVMTLSFAAPKPEAAAWHRDPDQVGANPETLERVEENAFGNLATGHPTSPIATGGVCPSPPLLGSPGPAVR